MIGEIAISINKLKLDKSSSVPLYLQLQNFIIEDIKAGQIREGDMLPTEIELSEELEISRPTVRQALNNLVNEGYIYRIKGRGTFVKRPKIVQGYTSFIESYTVDMRKKGFRTKTKVLALDVIEADEIISTKLQIKKDDKVVKLKRLRFASPMNEKENNRGEDKPVLVTVVYVPYKLLPELVCYDFEVFSFYEVLDKNNLSVKKVKREIEAKLADEEIAKLLKIEKGDPIHFITSVGFLENNVPIEYSESIYPGERNKFVIEISR